MRPPAAVTRRRTEAVWLLHQGQRAGPPMADGTSRCRCSAHPREMGAIRALLVALLAGVGGSLGSLPDITLNLSSSAAAPVTHEAAGLLNNLPQDAHGAPSPVLRPLKIANYRGLGSLDGYSVLAELGTVKHSQVLLFMEWCWYWAPGNSTSSRCTAEHMPGAHGNWSGWEEHLRGVVQRKLALRKQTPAGPAIWWDIWSEFRHSAGFHKDRND